jgi:D-alanyl-D-alanine carboxypeptidase/D-alanyl-D-alanine-endopeptidase (penicillin-binding protein 4)
MVKIKSFTFFFIALIGCNGFLHSIRANHTSPEEVILKYAAQPSFSGASIGLSIHSVQNASLVYSFLGNKMFVPASTQKLLTGFAALDLLGADFVPVTRVFLVGNIKANGHWDGDMIIRGAGDPALGSRKMNGKNYLAFFDAISLALKKIGVTEIGGRLILQTGLFESSMANWGWSWEDLGLYYGAGASGLSFLDNYAQIYLSPQGQKASVLHWEQPELSYIVLKNEVNVGPAKDRTQVRSFGAEYHNERILRGILRGDEVKYAVRVSIPDPAKALAFLLYKFLLSNGISIVGQPLIDSNYPFTNAVDSEVDLVKWPGVSMVECLAEVNKESNNLFAEHLFKHLSVSDLQQGNSIASADLLQKYWLAKGLNSTSLIISDGSGLSRFNAISPDNLSLAVLHIAKHRLGDLFFSTLPLSGQEGTLKLVGENSNLKGKIKAKSGTMTRVKCFAGVFEHPARGKCTFAFMVNHHTAQGRELKAFTEELWQSLFVF